MQSTTLEHLDGVPTLEHLDGVPTLEHLDGVPTLERGNEMRRRGREAAAGLL